MENIYTTGKYFENNETWHTEDSPWKAKQVYNIMKANKMSAQTVAELGCGAGIILDELSQKDGYESVYFEGFDISPQAIKLCEKIQNPRISFHCEDLLNSNSKNFDVLLVMDVVEHVSDYIAFVEECKLKAKYKIYHIPLAIHVSSVLRNAFVGSRYSLGHLHYFTAESALALISDSGHKIIDYQFTNAAIDLYKQHPSLKKAIANCPRWLFSKFSTSLTARIFGGYSLLVLAE